MRGDTEVNATTPLWVTVMLAILGPILTLFGVLNSLFDSTLHGAAGLRPDDKSFLRQLRQLLKTLPLLSDI